MHGQLEMGAERDWDGGPLRHTNAGVCPNHDGEVVGH